MNTLNGSLLPPTLQSTLSREGWKATTIGDLCITIRGGGTPSKRVPEYWTGNVPWATVKDLSNFDPFSTQDYISERGVQESATRIVEAGTLIISVRMLVARAVQFSIDVAINQDLKALELKDGVSPAFLRYWFNFRESYLANSASGSTVKGISTNSILGQEIYLPPRKEQEFIADSLTDADQLISSLERLISKKQAIKQGMMQELLTGRTRLPGFKQAWSRATLGRISKVTMGQSPVGSSYNTKGNGLPLIQGNADVSKRATIERVWTSSPTKISEPGNVILTVRAPVGHAAIASHRICLGRGVCGLDAGKDNSFLFHLLVSSESRWSLFSQGSTFTAVGSNEVDSFTIDWPCDPEERSAIAKVLQDADQEIDALQRRLESVSSIKQGMMQELLTGRVRLPVGGQAR